MSSFPRRRRQIRAAQGLERVVRTMKVMAAAALRRYEAALECLGDYEATLRSGLAVVARTVAGTLEQAPLAAAAGVAVVAFGSDQGLCGTFDAEVAGRAQAELDASPAGSPLLVLGRRVAAELAARGYPAEARAELPGSPAGLAPRAEELLLHFEAWHQAGRFRRLLLVYQAPDRGRTRVVVQPLFPHHLPPLDELRRRPWRGRSLPMLGTAPDRILRELIRQRVFLRLYRAFAESLASENARRLGTLRAAQRNLARRIEQLETSYRMARQGAITEELLDVTAGFEALLEPGP